MGDEAKTKQLKAKFQQLDKNGDGRLSYDEFSGLLKSGNSRMTPKEMKALFKGVAGDDGFLNFEEFVDYIYSNDKSAVGSVERSSDARHSRLSAANSGAAGDDEADWAPVQEAFENFAKGKDMDNKEFAKMVKSCKKLLDKNFNQNAADLIWAKICPRGTKKVFFPEFQTGVRLIAKQKGIPTSQVQEIIAEAHGPAFAGTQADAVRFHDDKSTYTGAHVFNEKHGADTGGADRDANSRHDRLSAKATPDDEPPVEGWTDVQIIFDMYAKGNGMDNAQFSKLVKDCGLVNKKFTANDIDLTFNETKVRGGIRTARKIEFEHFKKACQIIGHKREQDVSVIMAQIADSDGPNIHATKTDEVRFHDDKNSYTGMHVGK